MQPANDVQFIGAVEIRDGIFATTPFFSDKLRASDEMA